VITPSEAASELLRRRAAKSSLAAYVNYTNPNYKTSVFSEVVCASIDLFLSQVQAGIRPILVLCAPPQHGKQIADDIDVLTTKGWKTHGQLEVNDYVYGKDGNPTRIVALSEKSVSDCKVEFTNGEIIYCHRNHLWEVYSRDKKRNVVISTQDMLKLGKDNKRENALFLGTVGERGSRYVYQLPDVTPIINNDIELPIKPYTLGVWLGDGTRVKPVISGDKYDLDIIFSIINDGYPLRSVWIHKDTGVYSYSFDKLWADLKKANLHSYQGDWKAKRIPDVYLTASITQRLELLAGLIDTDGYVYQKNGRCVFTTAEKDLADSFCDLISTFGWRYTLVKEQPKLSSSGIQGKKEYYVIGFNPNVDIPCRLERKKIKILTPKRKIAIKSITLGDWGKQGNCIQVEADDGIYRVGRTMIPTHNSEIVSRKLPAYIQGKFPDWKVGAASYADDLVQSFAKDVRRTIASPEHLRLFPLLKNRNTKYDVNRTDEFNNPNGSGGYIGRGIGAGFTGRPLDIGIIDDPIKNQQEALSETTKKSHWDWYQTVFTTRMSECSGQIIMATQWAEDDLLGRIIAEFKGDPRLIVLKFPAINSPDEVGYNRDLSEGALVPQLHSLTKLKETKKLLSNYWWSAIYQQSPKNIDGNIFKEEFAQYYLPKDLPAKFDKIIHSWDCTFKDTDGTDYVVGQVWGKRGANSYLLDQIRERMSFTKTVESVVKLRKKWGANEILIEEKANGAAIIDVLKKVVPCLIAVVPTESKQARAHAVTSPWEAGNVFLPHKDIAPWVVQYIAELVTFPTAAHDDQVDATTQALKHLYPLFGILAISEEALLRAMRGY
jgi:predicted phage terminase large subunit-like protein